jgi:hypothetical protein
VPIVPINLFTTATTANAAGAPRATNNTTAAGNPA